jgi:hypothetical protein
MISQVVVPVLLFVSVVGAQFNCNHATNFTDTIRQKILDFHEGFRRDVALGRVINFKSNNFTFPRGKNMYKVVS